MEGVAEVLVVQEYANRGEKAVEDAFYFFPIEGICVKQPKVLQGSVQLTQAPIQGK